MDKGFKEFKLDNNILKALKNLGFEEPSEVQKESIPLLLQNKDIVVKSQTGSGKTASFGIPICENIEIEESNVQALIIVPTRELALQIKDDLSNIGRLKKVRVVAVFGKQSFEEQANELKQRVHIVVGTPGRVTDHINRGTLQTNNIKFMILDEADKMLNMGFVEQIEDILKEVPSEKVTALFSATISSEIKNLSKSYMKDPINLNVVSKVFNRDKICEEILEVEEKNKFKTLWRSIYAVKPEAAIIFCNTREKVKEVFLGLKREGFLVEELHGDMEQKDRLKTMEKLKNKEFNILVATDVASRGIHVDHITHVFNYEIPMEKESYIHRIGRTGRGNKAGRAISFVSSKEEKYIDQIEEYIGYNINKIEDFNDEEVKLGKSEVKKLQKDLLENKNKVKVNIHKDVTKIHISAGKKKKIRNLDVLGAFSHLDNLTAQDVGIIDIKDNHSYVDILNGKGEELLKKYKEVVVKGKKVRVSKAKN
ncbi:ATP-dependent RNA helicase DbpA [Clostridium collagenovorans DSM 3089]|uniref:ATP-dependent RNA helicase DbpA n=1 Tax=Clostridium collagenovorans DSM 3089 TaxID=1121306 RepID=A0A1M5T989_9CLOT|nr:DEAD/DEAH box helicase [Clostridium collagenovorans]SHH47337.1 ATP-dependent RNA helicase DbpA [Clostridium collagenovorans DSM 3089]